MIFCDFWWFFDFCTAFPTPAMPPSDVIRDIPAIDGDISESGKGGRRLGEVHSNIWSDFEKINLRSKNHVFVIFMISATPGAIVDANRAPHPSARAGLATGQIARTSLPINIWANTVDVELPHTFWSDGIDLKAAQYEQLARKQKKTKFRVNRLFEGPGCTYWQKLHYNL